MFYALSWFFVISLLALWSLAAWSLHAAAIWAASNAGAFSGAASAAGTAVLPPWLAPWVPPELAQALSQAIGQMPASLGPVVDALLQAAPTLAAGITVATWAVWGIGSAMLLALGAGMHLLIALWRRRSRAGARSPVAAIH